MNFISTQIIPAILPASQAELETKAKAVIGLVPLIQVDICDGIFVPTKTVCTALPFLDQVDYELDLMISQPEKTIEQWIELQPARIIIHLEGVKDAELLFKKLETVQGIIEIGVSISNDTPHELLETTLQKFGNAIQFVQCMGIGTIGAQQQPFDPRALTLISEVAQKFPELALSVDGSVNPETITDFADAGADRFVAGSAVFRDESSTESSLEPLANVAQKNIAKLESLLQ